MISYRARPAIIRFSSVCLSCLSATLVYPGHVVLYFLKIIVRTLAYGYTGWQRITDLLQGDRPEIPGGIDVGVDNTRHRAVSWRQHSFLVFVCRVLRVCITVYRSNNGDEAPRNVREFAITVR